MNEATLADYCIYSTHTLVCRSCCNCCTVNTTMPTCIYSIWALYTWYPHRGPQYDWGFFQWNLHLNFSGYGSLSWDYLSVNGLSSKPGGAQNLKIHRYNTGLPPPPGVGTTSSWIEYMCFSIKSFTATQRTRLCVNLVTPTPYHCMNG